LLKINVRKQATNDKLQGSVATYSRCGGVIKNQLKKTKFAESASEKKCLQSVNIWQSYKQKGGCLVCVVRLANTLLKVEENARHNPFFARSYAKY